MINKKNISGRLDLVNASLPDTNKLYFDLHYGKFTLYLKQEHSIRQIADNLSEQDFIIYLDGFRAGLNTIGE